MLNSNAPTFEQAVKVAFRIDGAIMGAEAIGTGGINMPIDVGSVQGPQDGRGAKPE